MDLIANATMGCVSNQRQTHVMSEDGTKIVMCKCKSYDASMWKCNSCGTVKNTHGDRKLANRHKWLCHNMKLNHALGIDTIGENYIEECNEESFALTSDFEAN